VGPVSDVIHVPTATSGAAVLGRPVIRRHAADRARTVEVPHRVNDPATRLVPGAAMGPTSVAAFRRQVNGAPPEPAIGGDPPATHGGVLDRVATVMPGGAPTVMLGGVLDRVATVMPGGAPTVMLGGVLDRVATVMPGGAPMVMLGGVREVVALAQVAHTASAVGE